MFWNKQPKLEYHEVAKILVENGYRAGSYGAIWPIVYFRHKTEQQILAEALNDSLRNLRTVSSQYKLREYIENLNVVLKEHKWVRETVADMETEKLEALRSRLMITAIRAEKDREPAFFQLLEAKTLPELNFAAHQLGVAPN